MYADLVRRRLGKEPIGAELRVDTLQFKHASIVTDLCFYDEDVPESEDYARRCASEGPQYWDAVAQSQLAAIQTVHFNTKGD